MPTKRQKRSTKELLKGRKQKKKFPELLREVIESSDILLEILDSRFIDETRNIFIEELIKKKNKQILYVLNKSDLINKKEVESLIIDKLKPHVFVSSIKKQGSKILRNKIKALTKNLPAKKDYEKFSVGVIGYPNVGKSSVINLLIGKKSAKTGRTAGFTKALQNLRLSKDIFLVDSPGVIPETEYSSINNEKISRHALVGARDYYKIRDPEIAVSFIVKKYPQALEKFYKIKFTDTEDFIQKLGKKKNILQKGGVVNEDTVARLILKDWQDIKI
jgi:hypothetical protein